MLWAPILFLTLATAGCANTYRAVITTTNPTQPSPQTQHEVVVVSDPNPGVDTNPGIATVIDVSGDTILTQVTVGFHPIYVALSNGGGGAYVVNCGQNCPAPGSGIPAPSGSISAFSPAYGVRTSNVQTSTLLPDSTPVAVFPTTTAASGSAGLGVYVAQAGTQSVAVLTGSPPSQVLEARLTGTPIDFAGILGGRRFYAIIPASNVTGSSPVSTGQVNAIDTPTNTVSAVIPTGNTAASNPVYGVMSPDGRRTFIMNKGEGTVGVINSQTNSLGVINPTTGQLITTIPVGSTGATSAPVWADYYQTGSVLAVADNGSSEVSIINVAENAAEFGTVMNVPVGPSPIGIAVHQDGTRAYVASQGSANLGIGPTVSVVDLQAAVVKSVISLPGNPTMILASPGTTHVKVYVMYSDLKQISVIDTDSTTGQTADTITATVQIQGQPTYMRISNP